MNRDNYSPVLCRACGAPIVFQTSPTTGTTWQTEPSKPYKEPHRCQEYLDNIRSGMAGYFLPKRWSYAPKTVEEWNYEKHIKAEYRRRKHG
jgi:hypothetical protein